MKKDWMKEAEKFWDKNKSKLGAYNNVPAGHSGMQGTSSHLSGQHQTYPGQTHSSPAHGSNVPFGYPSQTKITPGAPVGHGLSTPPPPQSTFPNQNAGTSYEMHASPPLPPPPSQPYDNYTSSGPHGTTAHTGMYQYPSSTPPAYNTPPPPPPPPPPSGHTYPYHHNDGAIPYDNGPGCDNLHPASTAVPGKKKQSLQEKLMSKVNDPKVQAAAEKLLRQQAAKKLGKYGKTGFQ